MLGGAHADKLREGGDQRDVEKRLVLEPLTALVIHRWYFAAHGGEPCAASLFGFHHNRPNDGRYSPLNTSGKPYSMR